MQDKHKNTALFFCLFVFYYPYNSHRDRRQKPDPKYKGNDHPYRAHTVCEVFVKRRNKYAEQISHHAAEAKSGQSKECPHREKPDIFAYSKTDDATQKHVKGK